VRRKAPRGAAGERAPLASHPPSLAPPAALPSLPPTRRHRRGVFAFRAVRQGMEEAAAAIAALGAGGGGSGAAAKEGAV
jgi:hypothetical protein